MKRALIERTKHWTKACLPHLKEAPEPLTSDEIRVLTALYRLVVANEKVSEHDVTALLSRQAAHDQRYLTLYRESVGLLNAEAIKKGARNFAALKEEGRDGVLGKLLSRYRHPDCEPTLASFLRVTGYAREQVFSTPAHRRLRAYVVREFLCHYYAGKRGWELAGYGHFPGAPEEETSEVVAEKVEVRKHSLALHLSDGTIESVSPEVFAKLSTKGVPERFNVKSGRQSAKVSVGAREQWTRAAITSGERPVERDVPTEFDCVIVGSGPVGAAAADVLVRSGMSVAMLESGDKPERNRFEVMERSIDNGVAWNFLPWEYEMHGDDLQLNTFAVRKVGGSSLAWGAVCPRFLENDFRLRSLYGVGMDWPLSYTDLAPDYLTAERFMGVSGHDDNPFLPRREAPFPMKGFEMSDSDRLVKQACDQLGIRLHSIPTARNTETYQGRSKCLNYALCRACPVGAMYSSDQTVDNLLEFDNFHLFTNAHARKVVVGDGNRIEAVRYHDRNGREHTLFAKQVILAAQGVENVRILLNSRSERFPNGVANTSGLLGKYLSEHLKFYLMGRVTQRLHPHLRGYETAASQQFQDHPERAHYSGGRIIVRENAGPVPLDYASRSGNWGPALQEEIRETFGHFVTLGAFLEQLPHKDNGIDLSPTHKNAFGDPAPRLHFKLMRSYEKRGYRSMKKRLQSIFTELGATGVREIMPPSVGGHYMCCHRMGGSVEDSVVNSNCEAHDVSNLYLAGSGSFTTGGVSNPTLTGVALAIRTARHITGDSFTHAAHVDRRELATTV